MDDYTSASLESVSLLSEIARAVAKLLDAPVASFWQADDEARVLTLAAFSDPIMDDFPVRTLRYDQDVLGRVATGRQTVRVPNVAADGGCFAADWWRARDLTSFLGVPVMLDGRLLAVLALNSGASVRQEPDVHGLFESLLVQAALAIRNARLLQDLRERQARLEALLDVNRRLGGLQPLEQLLETMAETCARLLNSDAVGFRRLEGDELVATGTYGDAKDLSRKPRLKIGESLAGRVAATGRPLIVNDLEAPSYQIPEHREAALRLGHRAFLGVPVKIGDRLTGVLAIRTRNPRGFSDADVAIATAFAAQAAVALENTRLYASEQAARAEAEALGERYRNVIESSIQGMCLHDGRVIKFANPAFAGIFGYDTPAQLVGHGIWDLVAPHEQERIRGYADARRRGEPAPSRYEFEGVRQDGQLVWVEALDTVTSWEGAFAYLTTCLDVTERKRAKERLLESQEHVRQMQKMEAVGRLAGGVAHDFNNLLTVITGRTQLMLQGLHEADPMRTDLSLIQDTAERAAALTRQLLAFSRKQVLQPKVVDVETVVSGLASMLRRLLGEDIELDIVPPDELAPVRADPGQLEQVIVNLAVNARDAMPRGGRLTIEIALVELDTATAGQLGGLQAGPHVMVVVSDSGVGMDEETRGQIFEPFFTTKDAGHGTGLGLATVYGIVQQHQGAIAVESAPGFGATFRIYLPMTTESLDTPDAEDPGALPPGTETVLLVEDEREVRTLVRDILEQVGYVVLEAANGDEAVEIARHYPERIDLLLTDVIMPRMSGREVAERVTLDRPGLKVIYISGYTDNVLAPLALQAENQILLPKPFTPETLTRTVRGALDSHG